MNTSFTPASLFEALLNIAQPTEYVPDWANGTGYFDSLAQGINVDTGPNTILKTVDFYGRKLVYIKIKLHETDTVLDACIVVFQRYSNSERLIVQGPKCLYPSLKDNGGVVNGTNVTIPNTRMIIRQYAERSTVMIEVLNLGEALDDGMALIELLSNIVKENNSQVLVIVSKAGD